MGNVVDLKMAGAGDEQPNPDRQRVAFEDVWKLYPRRVARKDAEKAWSKIEQSDHMAIIRAIEAHKKTEEWRKDGGQYIPYFASWLRGERWTDELETAPTMGQCSWNANGTRDEGKPRCTNHASTEKRGLPYCTLHAERA